MTRVGRSSTTAWPARHRWSGQAPLRRVVLLVLGTVLTGVPAGVLWWVLAPLARADVVQGSVYLNGHPELQAAQDCWFAIVLGSIGLLAATARSWRPARRELSDVVVLTVALTVVAVIAWRVGSLLGPASLRAQVVDGSMHPLTPLELHAYGVLLVGPFVFTLTRLLAAIITGPGSRRPV